MHSMYLYFSSVPHRVSTPALSSPTLFPSPLLYLRSCCNTAAVCPIPPLPSHHSLIVLWAPLLPSSHLTLSSCCGPHSINKLRLASLDVPPGSAGCLTCRNASRQVSLGRSAASRAARSWEPSGSGRGGSQSMPPSESEDLMSCCVDEGGEGRERRGTKEEKRRDGEESNSHRRIACWMIV